MSGAYGYDIIWLVVEPYTSEKWWNSSVGMMTFPIWWKNIKGSKPPNSEIYIYIYLYVYGWLWMYMGYSANDAIILSKKNNNKKYATSVFLHQLVIWSKNHFVIAESLGFPRVSGLTSIWLRTSACFARSRGYLPVAIPRSSERAENGSPVPKLQVPLWIPLVIQHSYWTWA